jgi:hypothetical protein
MIALTHVLYAALPLQHACAHITTLPNVCLSCFHDTRLSPRGVDRAASIAAKTLAIVNSHKDLKTAAATAAESETSPPEVDPNVALLPPFSCVHF